MISAHHRREFQNAFHAFSSSKQFWSFLYYYDYTDGSEKFCLISGLCKDLACKGDICVSYEMWRKFREIGFI